MKVADEPDADGKGIKDTATGKAMAAVLKGNAATGKEPLATTELKKIKPGERTATEQGMLAALEARAALGDAEAALGLKKVREP